jgi:uroporphyrinogen-III decarboxylase
VQYQAQKMVDDRYYGLRDYEVGVNMIDIYFDYKQYWADSQKTNFQFLGQDLNAFDKYFQRKKIADVEGVADLIKAVNFYNTKLPADKKASFYHGCTGAMDLFSIFRGTEHFFVDLYDSPGKVRQIFEFLTERSLEWLDFEEKTWGDYNRVNNLFDKIDIGEDYCAYLHPDLFDAFVKPYTGKLVAAWKGKAVCSLHTDGDMLPSGLHKLGELGIDELMGFSPNIDIKLFRKAMPNVILGGNIHPIYHMIEGSPDDVKKAAKYCFEAANQNQRFVLCTGGAITAGAKPENVDAFLEAVYEVTKY